MWSFTGSCRVPLGTVGGLCMMDSLSVHALGGVLIRSYERDLPETFPSGADSAAAYSLAGKAGGRTARYGCFEHCARERTSIGGGRRAGSENRSPLIRIIDLSARDGRRHPNRCPTSSRCSATWLVRGPRLRPAVAVCAAAALSAACAASPLRRCRGRGLNESLPDRAHQARHPRRRCRA